MLRNSTPMMGLLVLLAAVAGCTGDIVDGGWQAMRPLGSELATLRPPVEPADATGAIDPVEPSGALTLREALCLAMLHSPELIGASWEVRIAEARAIQASLPPNPEIGFDLESVASPRIVETVLSLGQVIFLSDKLARQKQVALLERDLAGWDWEARRIRVYSDTTKAFVALVAAQQQLTLAEEIVSTSRQLLEVTSNRVQSGKSAPLEEMKAKVELGTVLADLEQARQAVLSARQRLAASWGGTCPKFAHAAGRLVDCGPIPSPEQVSCLVEQNPEVARWSTEMQLRQAVVRLERRKAIPDLFLGAGYKREKEAGGSAANGFTVGASIPLPIFDRNQGGRKESKYNLARGYEEQRATRASTLAEIAEAYRDLASAHARAEILSQTVVPEARKAFDAASAGYNEGKFSYLDVLDAQRTLFDVRVQHLEALAECMTAVANVEGLIGQSIQTICQTRTNVEEATTQPEKSQEE